MDLRPMSNEVTSENTEQPSGLFGNGASGVVAPQSKIRLGYSPSSRLAICPIAEQRDLILFRRLLQKTVSLGSAILPTPTNFLWRVNQTSVLALFAKQWVPLWGMWCKSTAFRHFFHGAKFEMRSAKEVQPAHFGLLTSSLSI